MKKHLWIGAILLACVNFSCSKSSSSKSSIVSPPATYTPPTVASTFNKGADVSWVTQMEASGYKFYDASGNHC